MTKTQNTKARLSSKLNVLEEILIYKKGFYSRVKERGINFETARFNSLGKVLRQLIPNLLLVRNCGYILLVAID